MSLANEEQAELWAEMALSDPNLILRLPESAREGFRLLAEHEQGRTTEALRPTVTVHVKGPEDLVQRGWLKRYGEE